jgi:putative aldouronate transport system permease protein
LALNPRRGLSNIKKDWQIYALIFPAAVYIFMFCYMPMYGVQISFRDYMASRGVNGSPWVGLKHFRAFFNSYYWKRLIINTLVLNLYGLFVGFPIPIVLALMLNKVESKRFKSGIQTIIYIPHFISTVVLVGMLYLFLSPVNGVFNKIAELLGATAIYYMNDPRWFRPIYVISGIWQNAGWSTILFLGALTAIDPQLYESATIDGASQWHKILYIDIPGMLPIIVTVLIMNMGSLFSSEFQKTYLMQTPGNMPTSDTIGVYVYTAGLLGAQFSYTAAIGLMQNVINFIMLLLVNNIARKAGEGALW